MSSPTSEQMRNLIDRFSLTIDEWEDVEYVIGPFRVDIDNLDPADPLRIPWLRAVRWGRLGERVR